jgi:hypothetical protein
VTLFGTHIPVTIWTWIGLVAGGVLAGLVARPLAERMRWRHRPTLVSLLLLAVVLALTVTPGGSRPPLGLAACVPVGWSDVPVDIAADGGGPAGVALNVLLFLPLAVGVVLAGGRIRPALALLVLPPVVELAQTVLPGRSCGLNDVLSNALGILLGAGIGWGLGHRLGRAGTHCRRPSLHDSPTKPPKEHK